MSTPLALLLPLQALRVSMVEVSPHLRGMQWRALRCQGALPSGAAGAAACSAPQQGQQSNLQPGDAGSSSSSSSSRDGGAGPPTEPAPDKGSSSGSSSSSLDSNSTGGSSGSSGGDLRPDPGSLAGTSGWGDVPVSWHRSLEEVQPEGPAIYIAHEFLDALPVHQFQKTGRSRSVRDGSHSPCRRYLRLALDA